MNTDRIGFLTDMARRIRDIGADQVQLDALAAQMENEARLLRDGPDPEPLTEEEKAHLIDPITGDRKRVFQPGEIHQDRARAREIAEQAKKAAEVRERDEHASRHDKKASAEGVEYRPEPYRIGGEATEDEKRNERGLADDRRAAQSANQAAKPGPVNPVKQPARPVSTVSSKK